MKRDVLTLVSLFCCSLTYAQTTTNRLIVNGATDDNVSAIVTNGGIKLTQNTTSGFKAASLGFDDLYGGRGIFSIDAVDGNFVGLDYFYIETHKNMSLGTRFINPYAGPLRFATNDQDRMSISSTGSVAIGGAPITDYKFKTYGRIWGEGVTTSSASLPQFFLNGPHTTSFETYLDGNGVYMGPYSSSPLVFVKNAGQETMRIAANGNVGIGESNPAAKLAVKGDVHAQKLKVISNANWPDFVFEKDYKLPVLKETVAYAQQHKHLPGVPSAAEIARDGMDVGEMNRLLLQKVEELILHLSLLQDKVEAQAKELEALKKL